MTPEVRNRTGRARDVYKRQIPGHWQWRFIGEHGIAGRIEETDQNRRLLDQYNDPAGDDSHILLRFFDFYGWRFRRFNYSPGEILWKGSLLSLIHI